MFHQPSTPTATICDVVGNKNTDTMVGINQRNTDTIELQSNAAYATAR